jgi:sugar lactone lactonase YvrE
MKKILLITIFCMTSVICPLHAQVVSTFAGSGNVGSTDGTGTYDSFYWPQGLAVDGSGHVYVADGSNNRIRMITPGGVVSTFAGSLGAGSDNGTVSVARFFNPTGVAIDGSGNVYVADQNNHLIRKITPVGVVSTLAGSGSQGFANGIGTAASFSFPSEIAVDGLGNVYVADQDNFRIRKITPAGVVSTFAGSSVAGFANGTGTAASFSPLTGLALDVSGNVYVADYGNHSIRKITPAGVVSTLAGSGSQGSSDGTGTAASFNYPTRVVVDGSGNVYVADRTNNLIRKITPTGVVITLAGSGSVGSANGMGIAASFNGPSGVAIDGSGNLYVADTYNNRIRKITGIPTGIEELIFVSGIKLYPVPARQNLTLVLTLQCEGDLRLELINISAVKVACVEGNYGAGFNELTLAIGTLPAGIYVANVYFNGQVKSQKILIER